MNKKKTNQLINESSPYLLQHAYNPVEWYPWGEEAILLAQKENKPILVSIGYSTCHWCHVMERESFEDENVANYMNEHFINIKVDREERPDIDDIYMEAVQAMTGSGGWPLNCFLTPDLKPFYGGTYFPPEPQYGRPAWIQILNGVHRVFNDEKDKVSLQTQKLLEHISNVENAFVSNNNHDELNKDIAHKIFINIQNNFDNNNGGFGGAPKFPMTMSHEFLLNYYYHTKHDAAFLHVEESINKMIQGGIYDVLGGGLSRYATDNEWRIPHFEKMLYDNALFIQLLSQLYLITKKEKYKVVIQQTIEWLKREMTNDDCGFYSALDADSEGVEGKFYVWDYNEILQNLGDDAPIFNLFYHVKKEGNWEGTNILYSNFSVKDLADKTGMEEEILLKLLERWKKKLFLHRENRIRPHLDDKVLLDWNALMNSTLSVAYQATSNPEYKEMAEKNMTFIFDNFYINNQLYHIYKDGKTKQEAFISDYANLIEALLNLYEISFNEKYLVKANELTQEVIEQFWDINKGLFFTAPKNQPYLVVNKKILFDNAIPSGNATMLNNLQKLAIIFDNDSYRKKVKIMLAAMNESIVKYPQSFSKWAKALINQLYGFNEISILGTKGIEQAKEINKEYIPNKILMVSLNNKSEFPMLNNKFVDNITYIYHCENYQCNAPTENLKELLKTLI